MRCSDVLVLGFLEPGAAEAGEEAAGVGALELVLPTTGAQRAGNEEVAGAVGGNVISPKGRVGLGPGGVERAAVPETAVDEDGEFGFNRSDLKPEMFMIPDNVVRIGHEPVRLEVLTSITGVAFTDAYVRRIQVDVNGLVVPFIALVDLLKNKTSTGRGKDRVDVEALRKRANP